MNIYSSNSDFKVEIEDNNILVGYESRNKLNQIKNKNVKELFRSIQANNPNEKYIINDIVFLKYENVYVLFNTFHGNIIKCDDEVISNELIKKFKLKGFNDIRDHKEVFTCEPEKLIDDMGNLNSKVRDYANKCGLDIRSATSSIRMRLSSISNDYSYIEKYYKKVIDEDLLAFESNRKYKDYFKEMSIIVPMYNTNVIPTLLSIESQDLTLQNKKKIEVILIDDGSTDNNKYDFDKLRKKLTYTLRVVSFEKNMGLSNARNVGLQLASNNLLLFMDSDILLSKNYLYDMNIRLQLVPNAIFVSMRKNIERDSEMLKEETILKGIEHTLDVDDSRVVSLNKDYHIGLNKRYIGETISTLDDTNFFKQLSFGSKVGIYDLSTIVAGHNFNLNKTQIIKYPAFSPLFKGWGMEDAYFASSLISYGTYVIPVLSSNVYHIKHEPRSGNNEKKREEALRNYNIYNELLDENW